MSLSNSTLIELSRFARLPEGQAFVELIKHRLAEADAKTRIATGEEVYRSQGRAQALAGLIEDIEQAQTRLTRSTGSQRAPAAPQQFRM
jgi:hypothetical protein